MHKKPTNPPEASVACEVCLKEIPRSVAHSNEGSEYVYYFCGDACYARWQEKDAPAAAPGKEPVKT